MEFLKSLDSKIRLTPREQEFLNLYKLRLSKDQITEIMGISDNCYNVYLYRLRKKKYLPPVDKSQNSKIKPSPREQEFLDLYKQRLSKDQITEIMGISDDCYNVYFHRLRRKGYLPLVHTSLTYKGTLYITTAKLERRVLDFVRDHEELFEFSSEEKIVDIEQIENAVKILHYRKQDVNLLVRLYAEERLYEETLSLLYNYEANNELSDEEAIHIAKLKHILRIEMLKELTGNVPNYLVNNADDDRSFMEI